MQKREITSLNIHKRYLRERVRAMEAFGWVLGETTEQEKNIVLLNFWRPLDLPESERLLNLELELSRIPIQENMLGMKYIIGVLILVLIGTVLYSGFHSKMIVISSVWLFGIFMFYILEKERLQLRKKRERLIERAEMLTSTLKQK